MTTAPAPRCPTCGAAFRGGTVCGRCGTDLRRLTALLLEAHTLRERAREALREDRPNDALALLASARRLQDTEAGRRLEALALIGAGHLQEGVHRAARLVED